MTSTTYYRFQWEKNQNGHQSAILNLITKQNDVHMSAIMPCPCAKFKLNRSITFRDMVVYTCMHTISLLTSVTLKNRSRSLI